MSGTKQEARLNFRLAPEIKRTIEEAAAQLGQTVSDFAVSTLIQAARQVIREQNSTQLSERDRKRFVAMLDDESTKPNKALTAAANRYKKQIDR
ncbi:MAG: DUF1778 domain-containing protein [Pirellula sp.]